MATYLLTWNPRKSPADEPVLQQVAQALQLGDPVEGRWSAGNNQGINVGDRVFLLRQGRNQPGILGAGQAVRGSYWDAHREPAQRRAGREGLFIDVRWDSMVEPRHVLPRTELLHGIIPATLLKVACSGATIPPPTATLLEQRWADHRQAADARPQAANSRPIQLSALRFQQQFARFDQQVRQNSGQPFTSFQAGLPADWEDYKERLRAEALTLLQPHRWRPAHINKSAILEHLLAAIEINLPGRDLRNNLVRWENRWGHKNRSHRALLDARSDAASLKAIQQWAFDFFHDLTTPADAFERLRALIGNRYDLAAYLFFLKDSSRFMPIAPTTFDQAFELLGVGLATSGNCSWENYSRYNDALLEVRKALREVAGVADARLIDAHSFCWMLVRLELPGAPPDTVIPLPENFSGAIVAAPNADHPAGADGEFETMDEEDFAEREKQRRRLGRLAQDIALESERRRLRAQGWRNPAEAAKAVWHEPARGYDILSQEQNGSPRHIEVKAARFSGGKLSFFLTENERKKARILPNYYFYLVLDAQSERPAVRILATERVTPECLRPTSYIAGLQVTGG